MLTQKQLETVQFLESYKEENGIMPTLKEIAENFGVSIVTIWERLKSIEKKGIIKVKKKSHRAIQIIKKKIECPYCGQMIEVEL